MTMTSGKRGVMSSAAAAALLFVGVAASIPVANAQVEESTVTVDITAQPLASALRDFSRQTGIEVIAAPEMLEGVTAGKVSGRMSPLDALTRMIGTAALAPRLEKGAVVLVRTTAQAGQPVRASYAGPQQSPPAAPEPAAAEPVRESVVVTGYRKSFANSLELKRNANQVIDVISAEEIGQFPDQNVSEAIQRVTGVQITRNNGEGESVNIRGLSANFTRVEIDGRSTNVTIDSANPDRASVLSVFASDLYSTIEVVKSPTAADVEGGVGGIVRLKTPNPLEIGTLRWGLQAGVSQADQREDAEPR
ncbi:MAG: TonB-dependent receptor plug domain-containing protein [Hyphomonadaceae bacterium]